MVQSFFLKLGYKSILVVSSPSAIEECMTKNDIVFANRPKSIFGDYLSYNYTTYVWSSYGHLWRTLRRLSVVELFSSQSLQKSTTTREENLRAILHVLHRFSKSGVGHRVDLNYLSSAYSFNNIMKIIAGKQCIREEEIGNEVGKEIVKRARGTFFIRATFGVSDFFPFLRRIRYKGNEKKFMSVHKMRDEFLENLLMEKNESSLIGTLCSLQESEPEFYTNDVIKGFVLLMFIAGTETVAVTIESAMSLLLSHPDKLLKLRHEIDDSIGHKYLLNESDLSNLPYLRGVVNEALRLRPPAPALVPHYSLEDCTVGGYKVPKNTILLVNAWGMHMDPKVWNEPEKFKPERYEAMDMERACPGGVMGLRTVSLAVGALVQCFEWEKVLEHEDFDKNWKGKAKPLQAMCVPRPEVVDILKQL